MTDTVLTTRTLMTHLNDLKKEHGEAVILIEGCDYEGAAGAIVTVGSKKSKTVTITRADSASEALVVRTILKELVGVKKLGLADAEIIIDGGDCTAEGCFVKVTEDGKVLIARGSQGETKSSRNDDDYF